MEDEDLVKGIMDLPFEELEMRFGTSPFMLSCWTCLASRASDKELRTALAGPVTNLWRATDKYERLEAGEEDSFRPGPHIVARAAAARK